MPQFDVYRNPVVQQRGTIPFMLDIQSDLLDGLPTRLTLPLALPRLVPSAIPLNLCPALDFDGQHVHVLSHLAVAFRVRDLGRSVGSLASQANVVVASLDAVISGV
jgi:toxin CcdB